MAAHVVDPSGTRSSPVSEVAAPAAATAEAAAAVASTLGMPFRTHLVEGAHDVVLPKGADIVELLDRDAQDAAVASTLDDYWDAVEATSGRPGASATTPLGRADLHALGFTFAALRDARSQSCCEPPWTLAPFKSLAG